VFSKSEVRLISLLKMNMTSKEIADIMGISDSGVKKARYRLRKKMNLEDSELQGFLLSFA
jgi:DNA-binding CsgD family transcriptional regulator